MLFGAMRMLLFDVSLPPIQLSNCILTFVVSEKLSGRNVVVLKEAKICKRKARQPGGPPELPLARPGGVRQST